MRIQEKSCTRQRELHKHIHTHTQTQPETRNAREHTHYTTYRVHKRVARTLQAAYEFDQDKRHLQAMTFFARTSGSRDLYWLRSVLKDTSMRSAFLTRNWEREKKKHIRDIPTPRGIFHISYIGFSCLYILLA